LSDWAFVHRCFEHHREMSFSFSQKDLDRIAEVLNAEAKHDGSALRFDLRDHSTGRSIALEIRAAIQVPGVADGDPYTLVSVYAASSFLQLQNCTGYIASSELGEVIFFGKHGGVTNGLVVEREAGCSLYANVDDRLLSADFTLLPPELIMCSVALSMSDTLFDDLG
jgi:hypothetical protein